MITTYSELQTEIADWLNRGDLTNAIKTFIQLAEQRFERDKRVRKLALEDPFVVDTDGKALPADIQSLDMWQHDGPVYFGPIRIVTYDSLGSLKARLGRTTGPPSYAALVDGAAYFAPEPDGTYNTKLSYWKKIVPLSDANPTNWLLDDHPDLYLYGALVESAPYLKDDPRILVWGEMLERRLEELHLATWNEQFSGYMVPTRRSIG